MVSDKKQNGCILSQDLVGRDSTSREMQDGIVVDSPNGASSVDLEKRIRRSLWSPLPEGSEGRSLAEAVGG